MAVLFVLAEGKDLPVDALAPDPLDLVQQHLFHRVGLVTLAGEEDAAAAVHPQHFSTETGVGQAGVVQAAVERRHPAADAAKDEVVQQLAAQIIRGERRFLEAEAKAGL